MPEPRYELKKTLDNNGKTLADLCRATNIPYPRLSGAVNGYWKLNKADEKEIQKYIDKIDNRK